MRDTLRAERAPNIVTAIPLSASLDDQTVRRRLESLVAREDVLRTVDLSLSEGARYSDATAPALPSFSVENRRDLVRHVRARAFDYFERDGLLWDAAIVHLPSGSPRSGRHLVTTFDHLITDGYSEALFLKQLTAPSSSQLEVRPYREWVRWQRRAFPDPTIGRADSHDFWAKTLAGTAPDRPASLSFCVDPNGKLSGMVCSLRRVVEVPISGLARAAARVRTTPFVLFLGLVAHTATLFASESDLTLRVNTAGRSTTYLDTLGFFSDNLPVRITGQALADPLESVLAARSAWFSVLPHQVTPFDYLLRAFGRSPDPQDPNSLLTTRPAQLLINFLPWERPAYTRPNDEESEYASEMGTFQAIGSLYDDGVFQIQCEFDPARFDRTGAVAYLDALAANIELACKQLVE